MFACRNVGSFKSSQNVNSKCSRLRGLYFFIWLHGFLQPLQADNE